MLDIISSEGFKIKFKDQFVGLIVQSLSEHNAFFEYLKMKGLEDKDISVFFAVLSLFVRNKVNSRDGISFNSLENIIHIVDEAIEYVKKNPNGFSF